MSGILRSLYERETPRDPAIWHKWNTLFLPVRSIDGTLTIGLVWRRRSGNKWQYQRREETAEEWLERQS
jgi:hypothetical protein